MRFSARFASAFAAIAGLVALLTPLAAVAAPAGQRAVIDVYDTATRTVRHLTVPRALLERSRRGAGPQLVPPSPRVMRDPVLRERARQITARRPAGLDRALHPASRKQVIAGTYHAIVLLVDFVDHRPHWYPGNAARDRFQSMLFSTGGYGHGSMRDWYRENSYGICEVDGEVTGGAAGWYRAPARYTYYVDGNNGFNAYPRNAQRLVEDTVRLADRDVDFRRYDNDGDDYVDSLFVVHSGIGAEATGSYDDLWSHMWSIPDLRCDGVTISDYSMEPEDGGVGVFCHEYGHVLGADDLYDYGYDSAGVGVWSVMSGGSWGADYEDADRPSHFDPYHKIKFGWIRPTLVTADTADVSLPPVEKSPTVLKLCKDGRPGPEYFLVENRSKQGFDSPLYGQGLLVWHIDVRQFSSYVNDNEWFPGQDPQQHYAAAVEQADGRWDLEHNFNVGDAGDPFPGTGGATSFNLSSKPDSGSYLQGPTGISLSNIRPGAESCLLDVSLVTGRRTWYVKASASGYGNGASPATPFATIGQAVAAANSGDTILLAPGVYTETVSFGGKELLLTSVAPHDGGTVRNTVLRAAAPGPTVLFRHGEQRTAVLRGLTITHLPGVTGHGVNISGACPTLDRCVIRDNVDQRTDGDAWGGGVLATSGADPRIVDCTFTGNAADYGAGLCVVRSAATVESSRFEGNRASLFGGGVALNNCSGPVTVRGCSFLGNEAKTGGGLYSWLASSVVTACRFGDNAARNDGGAVQLEEKSSLRLVRATIYNCRAFLYTNSQGGGLDCTGGSRAQIESLSLYGCSAPLGAGVYCDLDSSVSLISSIIAGCTGPGVQGQTAVAASYCDLWGNSGGDYKGPENPLRSGGNLSANPQFVDPAAGNLRLKSRAGHWAAGGAWVKDDVTSPCIDAGAPGEEAVGAEPQPNGGRLNQGAEGGTAQASLSVGGSLLAATSPVNGASDVVRRPVLKLWFRRPVVEQSAQEHFGLIQPALTPSGPVALVSGRYRWLTAGKVMEFVPDRALVAGTEYTAHLSAGVRLQSGETAEWAESFTFNVGGRPAVVAFSPTGAGAPSTAGISVTFDHDMNPAVAAAAFSLSPPTAGSISWPTPNNLLFTPHNPLRLRTDYQVKILASAADEAGLTLGEDFGWRFRTADGGSTAAVVTAAAAGTAGGGAAVTVNLAAAANVTVSISNIAGLRVASLPARDLPAGVSTLLWDGRSATGTKAPAGSYLVRVEARAADGGSSSCITLLRRQ